MRVVAVTDSTEVMGAEHSLLNLASALEGQGVSLTLAARPGGSLETEWCRLGLPFRQLDLPLRQGFRPHTGDGYHAPAQLARLPMQTAGAVHAVLRLMRGEQFDVVHSNSLMTHLDCATAGRLTGTPTVLEIHEILSPGVSRFVLGGVVRLAGTAIAISGAVRDQLPSWAKARAVVIPQGVDPRRFHRAEAMPWRSRLTAESHAPLVAAVGRVDPEKGLHLLIEAVAAVRRSGTDLHLAIVGSPSKDDGSYLEVLRSRGEQSLGSAFRVIPQVTDVQGVLSSVDVLACPSPAEPFGLILLEAQMCGVVVLACKSGGPADFIHDGETGVLVPPNDPEALAAALERLVSDPEGRKRLALMGHEEAMRRYTVDVRSAAIAALYGQLVSR